MRQPRANRITTQQIAVNNYGPAACEIENWRNLEVAQELKHARNSAHKKRGPTTLFLDSGRRGIAWKSLNAVGPLVGNSTIARPVPRYAEGNIMGTDVQNLVLDVQNEDVTALL